MGKANIKLTGNTAQVSVDVHGLLNSAPHAMHIHIPCTRLVGTGDSLEENWWVAEWWLSWPRVFGVCAKRPREAAPAGPARRPPLRAGSSLF